MDVSAFEARMMRLTDRFRQVDISCVHAPLNRSEFHVMGIVCRAGENGIKVSALSEETGLPMPAISRLMRGLEKNGLITRSIAPHDRRSILVRATEAGRAQFTAAVEELHEFMTGVYDSMSEDERDRLTAAMDSWLNRVEERLARWKQAKEESD